MYNIKKYYLIFCAITKYYDKFTASAFYAVVKKIYEFE